MAKKKTSGASSRKTDSERNGPHSEAAYFLSLTVRNLRCFGEEAQTLDLSDGQGRPAPWTILLGNNGTGKTTLLQVLAGFDAASMQFEELVQGKPHTSSSMPSVRCVRALKWHSRGFRRSFARADGEHSEWASVAVAWGAGPLSQPGPVQRADYDISFGREFPGLGVRTPVCYGYGVARRMGTSSLSDQKDEDATRSLFSDRVSLRNAEEWLLQLDYSASKRSAIAEEQKRRLERVRALLIDLLPDVEDIQLTQPTRERRTPQVRFKTPYGWVPLSAIAYGYQTLLVWIVDLASRLVERYPDSDNPLAEPAVILVDEIDLHLHPSWQRQVMGYLSRRFPNTQFVVTAHSPLVVQAAPGVNANVAVLRRKGDHVVIDNEVEAVRGWRIDQVLSSDLYDISPRDPQIQDLLDKRRRLLAQAQLSNADRNQLKEIEAQIGPLPAGETEEDIRTIQLLEKSLELLDSGLEYRT